ncbi:MAG: 50S ribosomal protein L29 [bacterium]|nr:50S ribosomal protein L29 [bacterium]
MKTRDFLNEIKTLDIKALVLKSKTLKGEIADLVLDKNMNKLKDLKSIDKKRKDLARTLTVLEQKRLIEQLEKVSQEVKVSQVSQGENEEEKPRDTRGTSKTRSTLKEEKK